MLYMSYKDLYSKYFSLRKQDFHFAAHSHHPWPDCSYEAHMEYWEFSNRYLDNKWEYIYSKVVPEFQNNIAGLIGSDAERIIFAPNTHELVYRLLSCFFIKDKVRVLTTEREFHSFRRQIDRLSEWDKFHIDKLAVHSSEQLKEDLLQQLKIESYDLIFFSHVFFNTGMQLENINLFLEEVLQNTDAHIAVDGYHSLFAFPANFSSFKDRIFVLGGGYKYAQAGEGVCFMSCPDNQLRPINTGWFAEFEDLEASQNQKVGYSKDGYKFAGSTMDFSGLFRMNSIFSGLNYIKRQEEYHNHCKGLKEVFMEYWKSSKLSGDCEAFQYWNNDAHYISFKSKKANELQKLLLEKAIVTDCRGDILRFGFGIYQDKEDIVSLFQRISQ